MAHWAGDVPVIVEVHDFLRGKVSVVDAEFIDAAGEVDGGGHVSPYGVGGQVGGWGVNGLGQEDRHSIVVEVPVVGGIAINANVAPGISCDLQGEFDEGWGGA